MAQTFTATWSAAPAGAANVWMAAPDILAFYVDDPPLIMGNYETGSFSGNAYGTWFQRTNPAGGPNEWCTPIGINRTEVKFSDKPNPAGYLDKVKLHTLGNYAISGGGGVTISSVHYRDEANDQGMQVIASSGSFQYMITQRHTVLLKLSGAPTQGASVTITNTAAGITPITFTFNDKTTRAGGIQVNQIGQRPDDALRYAYLAMRLPKGPNNGTIQFSAAPYSMTSFQILNSAKATVFTGSIVQRCSSAAVTGEGYDSGIDVADLSVGWTITAINKATNTVTVPGHTVAVNDKVRFMGVNGMYQLENPPTAYFTVPPQGLWTAATVTAVSGNDLTISNPPNMAAMGTFAATSLLSETLGGVNNRMYKCFNTNRAGTYVYGLDFSSWTPSASGTHYIYIPGYGISDPFQITSNAWALAAAKIHEGVFALRLGIAVTNSSGYARGIALKDGTNGCQNYKSTLPAIWSSEYQSIVLPAGVTQSIYHGMGGFAGTNSTGTSVMPAISSMTCAGTTATVVMAATHGFTVGQQFAIQIQDCVPAGYNLGVALLATATTTTAFTYPVASTLANATTLGTVKTGFVTDSRTGGRPGHQDAGDNDDIAIDHLPRFQLLAQVFRNITNKPSRVTPYTVPLSSSALGSLFAGTDGMPPLFHEMFWHAEAYRTTQEPDGSVWGGYGMGTFSSVRATPPETIDKYRGNDALGGLTGQTVMSYAYARDHLTTFHYATFAALLAQIAYDYGLTTLGDTYKASAIAAYTWADGIITNPTTCDAYYKGVLNFRNKAGWTEASYQDAMRGLNGLVAAKRATTAKFDAAGALYHLLGSSAGQTPYGDFIEKNILIVATITNGGSGYAVNDIVTLAGGTPSTIPGRILVTAVDGSGAITGRTIMNLGQYTTNPTSPNSVTGGSGTGATFTCTFAACYTQMQTSVGCIGAVEYCLTSGALSAAVTYIRGHQSNINAPTIGLNPAIPYQGMYMGTAIGTGGGTLLGDAAVTSIHAHMHEVMANGIPASKASTYLQVMQAQGSFVQGANFANKAYITGVGPRPFKCLLHEDSTSSSQPQPFGINPFGYFGWGTSFMNSNFAGSLPQGAPGDTTSNYNVDNVSGSNESQATPGSTKMWNPWRGGSSYWEWSPENRLIIYNSEFTLGSNIALLATQLYLHGWDGNV